MHLQIQNYNAVSHSDITIPDDEKLNIIFNAVIEYYKADSDGVKSPSRRYIYVRPRQICMYYMRRVGGGVTLQIIGDYFGGYDHTSVIHSSQVVENIIEVDAVFRAEVAAIGRKIAASGVLCTKQVSKFRAKKHSLTT